MVWTKCRDISRAHSLVDTARGVNLTHESNTSNAQESAGTVSAFNSDGYDALYNGTNNNTNYSGNTFASWTFRKAPGFFDIVTFTGSGSGTKTISHSLGSVPGMIIVKGINSGSDWSVYHRKLNGGSSPEDYYLSLNHTNAESNAAANWGGTAPTATQFTVGGNANASINYVAYIFAHDDAQFGTAGDESIIKCGSYSSTGSGSAVTVDLGFEPQFLLIKSTSSSRNWYIFDMMRGISTGQTDTPFYPNQSFYEVGLGTGDFVDLTPTGFIAKGGEINWYNAVETVTYMAIRRPNKPPTAATEVFAIDTYGGTAPNPPTYNSGFPVDLHINKRTNATNWSLGSRLMGLKLLEPNTTAAQVAETQFLFDFMDGHTTSSGTATDWYSWMFKRAPGFMDVVAFKGGNVVNQEVAHNLGVRPELIIFKARTGAVQSWYVYVQSLGIDKYLVLDSNAGAATYGNVWGTSASTSTNFYADSSAFTWTSSKDLIAFLFATLPGISKVGSYTGTGSAMNIDCGFTNGARFVLIKRTSGTGNWYLWDTARGIVSGNDPFFYLNTGSAQITYADYLDPLNSGFIVNPGDSGLNASGESYIFLAIA